MYPPVTSSTAAIKTQTFTQQKGRVFYGSKSSEYNKKNYVAPGKSDAGRQKVQETFAFRSGHEVPNSNLWRTRSSGSNGSSSGTPTSPSVSSPLSRTSSVGSSNGDRPGSAIARQAAVILRNSPPPVYQARVEKTSSMNKSKKYSDQGPASRSSTKSSLKPFNHREVLEQMDKAFLEAKQAIELGHGKIFDPNEHGPAVVFKPFDWEEFWGQRKMNGL